MAPGEKSLTGRAPASRRSVVKGLGAAGAALSGMLPRWSFAQDAAATYAKAAID
ncbi:MAG TPA: twin-arginine translocation signal domain-containing protein [Stellaceae bacterium]|nr:twin-arginine translocation signal domain-containing protein [Stellaceae bacterium]